VKGPLEGRNLEQVGAVGDEGTGERIAETLEILDGASTGAATHW
jgi:hypothetical protein